MRNALNTIFGLLRQTFEGWTAHNAPRLAAALAYYIAFSLAPLLVITIAVVGFVLQESVVRVQVLGWVNEAVGPNAGDFVAQLIADIRQPTTGILSTLLGIGALLMGALGAFEQLKEALNTVWDVPMEQRNSGVRGFFLNKLLSFGMVLVVGLLLLASLILSTLLGAFESYTLSVLPGSELALRVVNIALSYGVMVALFALIYRFLPDIRLEWRDVWVGALVTTVLFNLGKAILSAYLVGGGATSAYGAAGSFALILLWIYYSAQIVLFGAEFTQVYSRRYGSLAETDDPAPAPVAGD